MWRTCSTGEAPSTSIVWQQRRDRISTSFSRPRVFRARTAAHTLYGHHLPAASSPGDAGRAPSGFETLQVEMALPPTPEAADPLGLVRRAPLGNLLLPAHAFRLGTSNPVPVYFALAPVVLESGSNDAPQTAQAISVPCEVQGQFFPARDRDWFQFPARQGEVLGIEVFSHRLGIDTDPVLVVQRVDRNERGEEVIRTVAQADDPGERANRIGGNFDLSTDDPWQKLVVESDGTYRVLLRDQFAGWRSDPRRIYRLVIRPLRPDFDLVAVPWRLAEPANDNVIPAGTAVLRRGGTIVLEVFLARHDGFAGEIELAAEELPPGIRCRGVTVGGARTTATLVLEASPDATSWSGNIRVVGRSRRDDEELVREARAGTVVWGSGDRNQSPPTFRAASCLAISVIDREEAPASIEVGEDRTWETSRGGKLDLPVRVQRRSGFDGELKLAAVGLPNELKPADVAVPGNASEAVLSFQATNRNAQPGVYTFYLRGDAKYKRVRNPDLLAAAQQEQQERESQLKQLTEAAQPPGGSNAQAAPRAETGRRSEVGRSHESQRTSRRRLRGGVDARARADRGISPATDGNRP